MKIVVLFFMLWSFSGNGLASLLSDSELKEAVALVMSTDVKSKNVKSYYHLLSKAMDNDDLTSSKPKLDELMSLIIKNEGVLSQSHLVVHYSLYEDFSFIDEYVNENGDMPAYLLALVEKRVHLLSDESKGKWANMTMMFMKSYDPRSFFYIGYKVLRKLADQDGVADFLVKRVFDDESYIYTNRGDFIERFHQKKLMLKYDSVYEWYLGEIILPLDLSSKMLHEIDARKKYIRSWELRLIK